MMKNSKRTKRNTSTEEKIKNAARKLFTQKGYSAVKTRDIAAEAGINLALLNYYFRNKQKLFEIIMLENLERLKEGVLLIMNEKTTMFDQKIELIVSHYIEMLIENPDLPLFVLGVMRHNPDDFIRIMNIEHDFKNSLFVKQASRILNSGKQRAINPIHYLINIMGMIVFPVAASPMIMRIGKLNRNEFIEFMQERKKLIPRWIGDMAGSR
jgi:AcrR family transcriptional regulator